VQIIQRSLVGFHGEVTALSGRQHTPRPEIKSRDMRSCRQAHLAPVWSFVCSHFNQSYLFTARKLWCRKDSTMLST